MLITRRDVVARAVPVCLQRVRMLELQRCVSVPVHSCVLSAFSPRFYGTLSSMPVLMAGQRRLIELQAVDGCTLLSLVSLLYSGQLRENREQVLLAAQTLGFELPQWEEEERHAEKVGKDNEQEKEVDALEWDDGITRIMEKGSRKENGKKIESGTQTEGGKPAAESGALMDLTSSKPYKMYLIDPSSCPTSQELGSCLDIQNVALPLQSVYPTSVMASEAGDGHLLGESAYLSEIYLYSLETSNQQTSTSVTLPPHNSFLDQSVVVPAAGTDALNSLKQFEGNIPGFINYFLESTDLPNKGRRGQSCAREGTKEEEVVKSARARSTARESGREWRSLTGGRGRRQRRMERWGLVARLAWRGQGGGRVGRLLESRSTGKNRMRAAPRRQDREALVEAGEARGRGRRRQRGKAGKVAGSEKQKNPPCKHRSRGRPCIRPLPPASRSVSTTKQNTVDSTELNLLHTMTPVPDNQIEPIQPIDTLLEDIMTGLHFLPQAENQTSQHGLMTTTTSSGPPISKAICSKPTDPKQHMEGEIGDILDHFLRTFDQHVGCCGLDVGSETSQGSNKPDSGTDPCSTFKTFTALQPHNSHVNNPKPQENYLHTFSLPSTQGESMVNPSVAKKNNVQDGQKLRSKLLKPLRDQNIVQKSENRMLTRSQTKKRKVEAALIVPRNAVKRKCKEKESADTTKKRRRDNRRCPRCKACLNKSGVKKHARNNTKRAAQIHSKGARKRERSKNRFGRNKRYVRNGSCKTDGFNNKKRSRSQKGTHGNKDCYDTKRNLRGKRVVKCKSNCFQAGQSSVKNQTESSYIRRASPAMDKVKMLLQLQDKRKDGRACKYVGIHWGKNEENGRLVKHQCISGAEERFPGENGLKKNQEAKDKDRMNVKRQEERMTEGSNVSLQSNLPPDTTKDGIRNTTAPVSTTESVTRVFDDPVSAPGARLLQNDVVITPTQSSMHTTTDLPLNVGDATQLTFASHLSHTQPSRELPSPLTSTGDLGEEDDDVDVVEVSSPTSDLPAVSILEVDLSTEDEVEEDVEIDVLGPD
ncbi:hypothetical protein Baya_13341 [Bagarius yarrelli]|uniref:BTB domain-containing protein n=1 Tax=Bagarius yarrelli TaxID=175774 RepID=A0A556V5X8_BAGYA|nr:hypothetical protein Baya_13341 [Bagarius yarrelli]